jgi:hypothetical protein
VVGVVHIGEHTLSKRLYEFSSTSASAYTADEFDARAREIEAQESAALEAAQPAEAPVGLLEGGGCEHLREPGGGVCVCFKGGGGGDAFHFRGMAAGLQGRKDAFACSSPPAQRAGNTCAP